MLATVSQDQSYILGDVYGLGVGGIGKSSTIRGYKGIRSGDSILLIKHTNGGHHGRRQD